MSEEVQNSIEVASGASLPITKIYWKAGHRNQVQIALSRHYGGQNLDTLTRMFDLARRDFPSADLALNTTKAVVLGGDSRKGMWGIEFEVHADTQMPEDYKEGNPEPLLAGGLG